VSNFVVESGGSTLDKIHDLLTAEIGIKIKRSGQTTERASRPFIVYDQSQPEKKYKRHQIMKHYSDYLGVITPEYKNPHKFSIQYSLCFDSQDSSCPITIQKLNRYLVSDRFKRDMDKLAVGYYVATDIIETIFPIEGFSDRQFIFTIDYFWADIWSDTNNNATSGAIETVQFTETTPPGGG